MDQKIDPAGSENYTDRLSDPGIIELVADRLQELRKRLLDASRRNPLVSIRFQPNSTSVLRVVDELPDVLRFNLTNGTGMRLVPLPALDEELPDEQTDSFLNALYLARNRDEQYLEVLGVLDPYTKDFEQNLLEADRALMDRIRGELGLPERQTKEKTSLSEHAKAHGISPSYSLPFPEDEHEDGRHQDTDIQTLMLPEKLSRVARGLLEKGRGFERETGVNVMHVAFGLLEWRSPGENSKYVSPLLLLEIRIDRKQSPRGAQFQLVGEGSVFVNTTLKQKLFGEHRLDIPDYQSGSVEDYFREIADAAPSGWEWSVRREVAIGIFPSSKIAMYHDLDPEKRPLAKSSVLGRLLATSGSGEAAYAPVYSTDDPETARKVPYLVMDADASQFSALVDVADDNHVSIEGPPGSGKSQSIVNLIAAALAADKKVLFVAEKLTALDVVKNRLEAAQLGEFILPLQAGKGTRDKVYQSLNDRLSIVPENQRAYLNFKSRQEALERSRQVLQDYLDALSSDFGTSGFTVYDVIGHAIASGDDRESAPKNVRRIFVPNCDHLDATEIEVIMGDAKIFADRLGRINRMPALWLDAHEIVLNRDDAEDVCESLNILANRMETISSRVTTCDATPLLEKQPFSMGFGALLSLLQEIESRSAEVEGDMVERLTNAKYRSEVRDLCSQVKERRTLILQLGRSLVDAEAWGLVDQMKSARFFAAAHGNKIAPDAHRNNIEQLKSTLKKLHRQYDLATALPVDWAERTQKPLSDIHTEAKLLMGMPDHALNHRKANSDQIAERRAITLKSTHRDLSEELGRIRQGLPRAEDHNENVIRETRSTISGSGMMRFMSRKYKTSRNIYANILGGSPDDDRETMANRLLTYADWLSKVGSFTNSDEFSESFGTLFSGLSTDTRKIDDLVDLHGLCRKISDGDDMLCRSLETDDLRAVGVFVAHNEWANLSVAELRSHIEMMEKALTEQIDLEKEACAHLDIFAGSTSVSLDALDEMLARKEREQKITDLIEQSPTTEFLGDRFAGTGTRIEKLIIECEIAELILRTADPRFLISKIKAKAVTSITQEVAELAEERNIIDEEVAEIARVLGLEEASSTTDAMASRLDDLRVAANDPSSLMERARLRKSEETLREEGFDKLVDWVLSEGDGFNPDHLVPIVRSIIAKSMADRAYQIHGSSLQGYDGEDFDRIRSQIVEKDRELIAMSRDVIRNLLIESSRPPVGNGVGRKSSYTDMALIRNEMGKKKNRIGVRELTRRAGRALFELKPCWMMSPLAVANYLHDGMMFDLVVIDEASQMTPENAIGALSRAHQAVVVGDTKQLPPTSFFQKLMDDSDTDEDIREDSESILDMANMAFRPVRQLRWHYRSRHSALIRFSNEWMYEGKLTIFPSAREDDPEFGVHLEEVGGVYKGRTNEIEARAVVKAAISHMHYSPDLSLGICTMNTDQKELIREEFERELERNRHVQAYVRDWQDRNDGLEEFFIKNLETIQGDERDVMFISTLYGPETAGGRPHQRFGPINSAHGHRRLNVLFTRAKRKIVTFTSLKPTDILVDEGKNRGVLMFRAWLEYCATGNVPDKADTGGGETENPFEDYVAAQIEALGCEAVPQVGASGYRIDIGVRHPKWPYGYILAVECDGASYHSSSSSRDRDRLRQEVLEGLGWRFHRIWSTDWFNDTRSQIERLKEAINMALDAAQASTSETDAKRIQIETEDIVSAEVFEMSEAPSDQGDLFNDGRRTVINFSTSEDMIAAPSHPDSDAAMIRIGSRVKTENLSENGRKLAFTIVEEGNDLENGKLGVHTPLGNALIDCQQGDVIEFRVGVEIQEILILEVN